MPRPPKRGMDAVIAKSSGVGRRKAAMKRKGGPGVAIMIAVGKPKPEPPKPTGVAEELDASKGRGMPKSQKIAALEEKIAYLQAELALLRGEDEEEGEDFEMGADESADDDDEEED